MKTTLLYLQSIFNISSYSEEEITLTSNTKKPDSLVGVKNIDNYKKSIYQHKLCETCENLYNLKTNNTFPLKMVYTISHQNYKQKECEKCIVSFKKNRKSLCKDCRNYFMYLLMKYTRCHICNKKNNSKKVDKSLICNLLNNKHYHITCLSKKYEKIVSDNEYFITLIRETANLGTIKSEILCFLENIIPKYFFKPGVFKRVVRRTNTNHYKYEDIKIKLDAILYIIKLKMEINDELTLLSEGFCIINSAKNYDACSGVYIEFNTFCEFLFKNREKLDGSLTHQKNFNINIRMLFDIEWIYINNEWFFSNISDIKYIIYKLTTSIYLIAKEDPKNETLNILQKLAFNVIVLHYNLSNIIARCTNLKQHLDLITYINPYKMILEYINFNLLQLYFSKYIGRGRKLREIVLIYDNSVLIKADKNIFKSVEVNENREIIKYLTFELQANIDYSDLKYLLDIAGQFINLRKLSIVIKVFSNLNYSNDNSSDIYHEKLIKKITDFYYQGNSNLRVVNELEVFLRIKNKSKIVSLSIKRLYGPHIYFFETFWYKEDIRYIDWILNSKIRLRLEKIISNSENLDLKRFNQFLMKCPNLKIIEFRNFTGKIPKYTEDEDISIYSIDTIIFDGISLDNFVRILEFIYPKRLIIKNIIMNELEIYTFSSTFHYYISEVKYVLPKINGIVVELAIFKKLLKKIVITKDLSEYRYSIEQH